MENEKVFRVGADVIYLAACALNGKAPSKENIEKMELEDVYKLASRHSMQAITYNAIADFLSASGEKIPPPYTELLSKWEHDRMRSMRKIVSFDLEREKLKAFFEANGIWYVELKGLIFQNYYPKLGMRQMGDNDILFDSVYREKLRDYMKESGYTVNLYGSPYPDTYFKGELSFEMHHSLYTGTKEDMLFSDYYENVKDKLIRSGDASFAHHFTDEDFYIYCTTHSYKHFSRDGNGIRSLMDVYVYLRKKGSELDFDYIDAELAKLGILDFAISERKLANLLFADCVHLSERQLTDEECELIAYYIDSGTYGTANNARINLLKSISGKEKVSFGDKLKYCMRRIFPSMDYYKLNHPRAYKYKLPIVFVWFVRIFRLIFTKRKKLLGEIKTISKAK